MQPKPISSCKVHRVTGVEIVRGKRESCPCRPVEFNLFALYAGIQKESSVTDITEKAHSQDFQSLNYCILPSKNMTDGLQWAFVIFSIITATFDHLKYPDPTP